MKSNMKKMYNGMFVFNCAMILMLISAYTIFASQAGEVTEWIGLNGGINWTKGTVTSEGIGGVKPGTVQNRISQAMACRAALSDARRNLLEIINGVRVESETYVEHIIHKVNTVKTSVEGVVRGAVIRERDLNDDGTCRVVIEAPLSGPFATTIYEHVQPNKQSWLQLKSFTQYVKAITLFQNTAYAADKSATPSITTLIDDLAKRVSRLEQLMVHQTEPVKTVTSTDPTGLVIDARGSNFIPSLHPRVREVKGGILYPLGNKKQEGRLISLFMNDLILAQNHPRVGEHPFVVKALRTYGKYRTEIVLGKDSAKTIQQMIKNDFLDHAEVIIVLD